MSNCRHINHIFLIMIIASALVACDRYGEPFLAIQQVVGVDGTIYAYAVNRGGMGFDCCPYGDPTLFSSKDGGNTWLEVATPPAEMEQKLIEAGLRSNQDCYTKYCTRVDGLGRVAGSKDGGITWNEKYYSYPWGDNEIELANKSLDYRPVCSKTETLICYRLNQQGQIERSIDGGANWNIDWELPKGRREFLLRNESIYGIKPDLRPLDLSFIYTAGGSSVVAAMGNLGIFVRSPQGFWDQRVVRGTRMLSFSAKSLKEACDIVSSEIVLSLVIAFFFSILLWIVGFIVLGDLFPVTNKSNKQPWLLVYAGLLIIFTAFCLYVLQVGGPGLFQVLCLRLFLIMMGIAWGIVFWKFRLVNQFNTINVLIVKYLFFIFIGTSLPYLLWAFGIIPTSETALLFCKILGSLVMVLGFTHVIGFSIKIAKTT